MRAQSTKRGVDRGGQVILVVPDDESEAWFQEILRQEQILPAPY